MNISAVVISYNPECELLFNNIKSYDKHVSQIIIIDNSTDFEKKVIIEKFCHDNKFVYHDMNGNLGIGAALNVGFDYAVKGNAEWVLTMDQDSCFVTDLEGYKAYINNDECENVIALIPTYDYYGSIEVNNEKPSNPIIAPQSGNLVKLSNFIKLGPYREDYFIDFVDYEYCLRAKANELLIFKINSVKLSHEPGVRSSVSVFGVQYSYFEAAPMRYYYVIRNGLKTALIYRNFQSVYIVIKTAMRVLFLEDKKRVKLKFVWKGFFDFFKF
jgi:rhamnosyltransferase